MENEDNQNEVEKPIELLSREEKFKEVQKQDWQIEALIIGSIIFGLVQVPGLVYSNEYFLKKVFGFGYLFLEAFIPIPFILLLVNLLLVLYFRAQWIIHFNLYQHKCNHEEEHLKIIKALEENAGHTFTNALGLFLFLFLGLVTYFLPVIFLYYLLDNEYFISNNNIYYIVVSVYSIFAGFIYIIGVMFFFMIKKEFIKYLIFPLYMISPFSFSNQLKYEAYRSFNLLAIMVPLSISTSHMLELVSLPKYDQNFKNYSLEINNIKEGCFAVIENERIENENVWFFLETDLLPKIDKEIEMINKKQNNLPLKIKVKKPNLDFINISVNGEKINPEWFEYELNGIIGVKTYFKKDLFRQGINKLSVNFNINSIKANIFQSNAVINIYKP